MGFFFRLFVGAMIDEQNEAERISRQTRLRQSRLAAKRKADRRRQAPASPLSSADPEQRP